MSKKINYRLYISLLFLALCPAVYQIFRTYLIGSLPDPYTFSIAGQLSWINLLFEILQEGLILPLFYFLNKKDFSNRLKTGLIFTGASYTLLACIICVFVKPMLMFMNVSNDIINVSATYIRLESIANIFGIITSFLLVAMVTLEKSKIMYILTVARVVLSFVCDLLFVSESKISLRLGINGVAYSNIISNIILIMIMICFIKPCLKKEKLNFGWFKELFAIGGISGLESFVRNIAYILMISKMVNMVGEQGTYWQANNFVWTWLLLPILQLGELIKEEVSSNKDNITSYFKLTTAICMIWVLSIPLWKGFLSVMNCDDIDKVFTLLLILLPFYVLFAYQNIFDSIFYGSGKTNYMLFESIVTNTVYYGIAFVLYKINVWTPSLYSIAIMFGIGIAFDSIVSAIAYIIFKKNVIKAD